MALARVGYGAFLALGGGVRRSSGAFRGGRVRR